MFLPLRMRFFTSLFIILTHHYKVIYVAKCLLIIYIIKKIPLAETPHLYHASHIRISQSISRIFRILRILIFELHEIFFHS
jgi:hypothetical protein